MTIGVYLAHFFLCNRFKEMQFVYCTIYVFTLQDNVMLHNAIEKSSEYYP